MAPDHAPIRLGNRHIEILLDSASGRILAVRNLGSEVDLIQFTVDTPPWRLEIDGQSEWQHHFTDFAYALETGTPATSQYTDASLRWEITSGIVVNSRITVPRDEPSVLFTVSVENPSNLAVDKIEYPILSGIGPLRKLGTPSYLVHSQGTGFLFRDPILTFRPEPGPGQGLRYSPYPEGFNGSTMQFMAYYAEDIGGFYFATRDPGKSMKWYNFFRDVDTTQLTATFMHQNPRVAPGADFAPRFAREAPSGRRLSR